MNDRIDDFIRGLRERIFEETRAAGCIGFLDEFMFLDPGYASFFPAPGPGAIP
jgi:hypothetical protein